MFRDSSIVATSMKAAAINAKILEDIASFPRATKLTYISARKKNLSSISANKKEQRIQFKDVAGKQTSIGFSRLNNVVEEFAAGRPAHVLTANQGGGSDSAEIETLLAYTPNIGWSKPKGGKKQLVWHDYPIHPLGETLNLDSDDWMEPEWALATTIYEVVVLPEGRSTIPGDLAKLLNKSTTGRDEKSWRARISNIHAERRPGKSKGFDGGPGTRKRAATWKNKYAANPAEVKSLAVYAMRTSPEAAQLAAKLGLPLPSAVKFSAPALVGTNIIYFGAPGTGKSHKADLMTASLPDTIRVLFHPEYTYNDFFGLYKPVVGSNPKVNVLSYDKKPIKQPVSYFDFVPGPLLLALAQAFASPQAHTHMIIDEINRGDCAGIFGDILQLLDRQPDGSSRYSISIHHEAAAWLDGMAAGWHSRGGKLFFPANFTILATMNTSDQGLYPMDSAFKRRWEWESCSLSFEPVFKYLGGRPPHLDDTLSKWDWEKLVDQINSRILNGHLEDKQIGPWFIAPDKATAAIDRKAFGNKCLYYLWHDVFKDDQNSDYLPFNDKPFPIRSFQELQEKFFTKGVAAIFKKEIWQAAEISAVAAAPETVEPVNAPAQANP